MASLVDFNILIEQKQSRYERNMESLSDYKPDKSLLTTHPQLAKQWHPTKNGNLKPTDVFAGSHQIVWWWLPYDDPKTGKHFDFEWQAQVNNRKNGAGCPYLSGKAVCKGFNDLETVYPQLAEQWHPTKNGNLRPSEITYGSSKKFWWIYPYDDPITGIHYEFEWDATVSDRVRLGCSCPYLSGRKVLTGFNDLASIAPQLMKEWDYQKNLINPTNIASTTSQKAWWKCKQGHNWEARIANRVVHNAGCPYCTGKYPVVNVDDFATIFPDLLKEWDYEKNTISPTELTTSSGKKFWWKCSMGHSWKTSISTRTHGSGCPYCTNRQIIVGFNDLSTTHPHIIKKWDYQKNVIKPTEVTFGSGKKVWWTCEHGHSWRAAISYAATVDVHGCPYCSNRQILIGFNDLATTHSYLLKEWDYEKNTVKPTEITFGGGKKVWWKCQHGHSWKTSPNRRTSMNGNCPYCSNRRVLTGFNDLATTHPHLLTEWDYSANIIKPTELTAGSQRQVWWQCKTYHHSWKANIAERKNNSGCPYCSNRKALAGFNDLETTHPKILAEWDYQKNTIKPTEVTFGSGKKVWWKCSLGHSWNAVISNRTNNNTRCPYCTNNKTLIGFNDLATTHPHLLAEWDYSANTIKPTELTSGSDKKVWWKCKNNHKWQATIGNRALQKTQCPHCTAHQTSYPEQYIYFYLKKALATTKNKTPENKPKWLGGKELDIVIPELKIAIEYDGYYFHKNIKRDEEKSNLCSKNGWKLIRVREIGCPQIKTKDTMIQVTAGKEDDLKKAILQILQICNVQNTSFSNLFDDKFIYSKK